MITRIYSGIQKIRSLFDPSRWLAALLGLSRYDSEQPKVGLILVQIDGLSHAHFLRAMQKGYLPFLERLFKNEHYRLQHHFSGLPSSTPAIQGELFYGVKQAVPAFEFRDHQTGKIFTFYHSDAAVEIEKRLSQKGAPLLARGSSYSNIYKGGAGTNAHFCAASMEWRGFFKAFRPHALFFIFIFNFAHVLKTFCCLAVEIILALIDSIRGTLMGFGIREELQFILSRILVGIGLREMSVFGVKLDIARGLPVIHVNFFSYDDYAHRRGPASRFAYWALRGIDDAVKSICEGAHNTLSRDYEVWIYSDHGQEEVIPYPVWHGEKIAPAVLKLFKELLPGENFELAVMGKKDRCCRPEKADDPQVMTTAEKNGGKALLGVSAQGPLGFIYPHRILNAREKEAIAAAMVSRIQVPLVLTLLVDAVYGFTSAGKFKLPQESEAIFGKKHPYLNEVGAEMESLCRHPDSGDFVISGWRVGGKTISFPMEYGSHAGPGPHETDGFSLIPADIRVPAGNENYLRPLIVRKMVQNYMHGREETVCGTDPERPARHALRVMTYNTHGCVGMDGKLSPERIARVIARHDPDVIALQELDVARSRSGSVDQARVIADLLDMQYHFHPVRMIEEEMYGNAVLSRYPIKVIRAGSLPRAHQNILFEPRGVLWLEIDYLNTPVQFLTTHLSFWGHERRGQVEAICGTEWLNHPLCGKNVILCGDFNALPKSKVCQSIQSRLQDVQRKLQNHRPLNTWFGPFPVQCIDHIFVSSDIDVNRVEVPMSRLEKIASDHLPLIAELQISTATSVMLRS